MTQSLLFCQGSAGDREGAEGYENARVPCRLLNVKNHMYFVARPS
jgi:hypothetical protein